MAGRRRDSTVERRGAQLVFCIPRRLETPNTWQGRHWRVKHRVSQVWEQEIWVAVAQASKASTVWDVLQCMNAIPATKRVCAVRMRVAVERWVPSRRHFISDDDNLWFSVKPLLDALTRQGFLRNDNRKWLDHATPTQQVSPDGQDWTVITLEPAG